ncbi:hypothetical protein SSX86_032892, partial [Deinandra increscens subsp. villosa]
MKTVVDISESETEDEVLGDGDGYESVTNLRTKRKHDVFKHLLRVRRSPRIAKNKDYSRFNNTVDNPICLDSPDMSDVLASGAKKESSSKLKIELEKKNDQHVRVTISDQKRKDDESAIVTSKAEKGESSSKRDSDTGKCKESDAGNTKSNQNHKIEEKRAKNGETPCKRKALMEQTKSKKNPKIFVPGLLKWLWSLVTQNGVVKIDEKLINSVLGVPIGTEEITSIEKTTERDPVAKEWRSQFREGKTKITMSDTNL